MRLVSFEDRGRRSWGAVVGDGPAGSGGTGTAARTGTTAGSEAGVVDLGARLGDRYSSVRELLAAGALDEAAGAAAGRAPDCSLSEVTLLPPVTDPARILCAGVNYDDHRLETGRDPTARPTIFTRYPSSLVGHGVPLTKPVESDSFDYEGELAVIIGRPARRVDAASALDHVAGYACFQDGSVRDWQRLTSQFTPGKNFEGSGAMGPWLVTADEVPDPQALELRTTLDGQVVQSSATKLMIFSVAELISFCSTFTTLEPGDVIATGTPGGVGAARKPPLWMRVGSTVEVDISGVGRLRNGVVEG
jgi:2-keto-4-pentenoate hydratase/2-oxohepta-3-ene-1,7-dioic acid hydratase in catechol pathway